MNLREMDLPALGVADLDNGLILALLIWESLLVLSMSKNFPISTWLFPVLGEIGYFIYSGL